MRQSDSLDLDDDAVIDHRIDPDAGEAGMPARAGIVGRDPNEAVNAGFRLEPAIGVVALDHERGALDPGLVAIRPFDDVDLVLPALGPSAVHALEHVRPVLALGATGPGMDLDIGVEAIGFAGQEGLDLAARSFLLDGANAILAFQNGILVAFHLAELDQRDGIVQMLRELPDRSHGLFEGAAFTHDLLRRLRIVPEVGVLGSRIQLRESFLDGIPVKDASSAVRSTAWRHPRVVRSRRASGVSARGEGMGLGV